MASVSRKAIALSVNNSLSTNQNNHNTKLSRDLLTAPLWISTPDLSGANLSQTQTFRIDKKARPRKRQWCDDWRELTIATSPYRRVSGFMRPFVTLCIVGLGRVVFAPHFQTHATHKGVRIHHSCKRQKYSLAEKPLVIQVEWDSVSYFASSNDKTKLDTTVDDFYTRFPVILRNISSCLFDMTSLDHGVRPKALRELLISLVLYRGLPRLAKGLRALFETSGSVPSFFRESRKYY